LRYRELYNQISVFAISYVIIML